MDEAIKKQVETELNFLKSQVNPHFLFNTLNNLYALSLKKSDDTPDAILKLSSILRYTLYDSNVPLVSFEKEKEVMQAYIDIEMLRLTDTGNVHFSILGDGQRQVPPLLWLPVLENVFKHGAHQLNADFLVDFRFTVHGDILRIFSKNRARRITDADRKSGGIGLGNLRKRLELLYPGRHSIIAMPDENSNYIVDVQINLFL
jgi:LytS/YehU family sensor histidine kinase